MADRTQEKQTAAIFFLMYVILALSFWVLYLGKQLQDQERTTKIFSETPIETTHQK